MNFNRVEISKEWKKLDVSTAVVRKTAEPLATINKAVNTVYLNKAATELARLERGENPTPKSRNECLKDLAEEAVDVNLCMDALYYAGVLNLFLVYFNMDQKQKRWANRIKEENENGTN